MLKKFVPIIAMLLFLILFTAPVHAGEVVYMCQPGLEGVVNVDKYLSEGVVELTVGNTLNKKALPGPAPDPYPTIHIWEPGIEQLGKSYDTVDHGIEFTGRNWSPGSRVLVIWMIRIYNAPMRMPVEFEDDLNVALWVDWNQDGQWTKGERMISSSFNVHDLFPWEDDHIEIRYLSWFYIPNDENLFRMFGDYAPNQASTDTKSVWTRCLLSYDDPDASPDGECLFGEYEDYLVTYKVVTPATIEPEAENPDK